MSRNNQCRRSTQPICYVWTSLYFADMSDCLISFFLPSLIEAHIRYDLARSLCTIQSGAVFLYDINLRATHTTILSIRGVTIPIYLVSSAMDSIR